MKCCLAFVLSLLAALSLTAGIEEDAIEEAEHRIEEQYTSERAKKSALKKLDKIIADESLSEERKAALIRARFIEVAAEKITEENAERLLLFKPKLTFEVVSWRIAHDVDGQTELIVSDEAFAQNRRNSTDVDKGSYELTASDSVTKETGASAEAKASANVGYGTGGLSANASLSASAGVKASRSHTTTGNETHGLARSWQDQTERNRNFEQAKKVLENTKLRDLHVQFSIRFSNKTRSTLIMPEDSSVNIYVGDNPIVVAKPLERGDKEIPARAPFIDILFRAELNNSEARKLVDYMRTGNPSVYPERSSKLIICSKTGSVKDALRESSIPKRTTRFEIGSDQYYVRNVLGKRPVTYREAFWAIDSQGRVPMFELSPSNLVSVLGVPCQCWDGKERLPVWHVGRKTLIAAPNIEAILPTESVRLEFIDAKDMERWIGTSGDRLSADDQARIYASLAKLGDCESLYLRALCLERGFGVQSNGVEAARCYSRAANGGHGPSQRKMIFAFDKGFCVDQQLKTEALKWLRKAAEENDLYAQFILANASANGERVEMSNAEAAKWFREAADKYFTGHYFVERQSYEQAAKCYSRAAELGDVRSVAKLGYMHLMGFGVEKSLEKCVKLYRQAAEQGDAEGQWRLGHLYRNGEGVEKSAVEAVKWFRKSAEQGSDCGQFWLGWCYINGEGVDLSYSEAREWFLKAAWQNNAAASVQLGDMSRYGDGVPKSFSDARFWYERARLCGCGDTNIIEHIEKALDAIGR